MSTRRALAAYVLSGFACANLFLVAATRPGVAADAGTTTAALKVLRHLEFYMTVGESSTTETKVSGFDAGSESGHATDDNGSLDAHGTITVDVVGATSDGGLAVDVSEDAASRKSPPIRVGILAGKLYYDPHTIVNEEERDVLLFLDRGFVKPDTLSAGTTWNDDPAGSGTTTHTTYKVKSVDDQAKTVALDFEGSTNVTGPNGFRADTHGTMTYDTGVSVPLDFTLWRRTHVEQPGRLTTVDTKLSATLREDSLRKPKA
jgi:hypothetical protein